MDDSLGKAHGGCLQTFEQLLNVIRQSTSAREPVESFNVIKEDLEAEFDRYKLWADNVGAGNSSLRYEHSLDYRLRDAPFYKAQILNFLEILKSHIERARDAVKEVKSDDGSDIDPQEDDESDSQESACTTDSEGDTVDQAAHVSEIAPISPIAIYDNFSTPFQEESTELQQLNNSIRICVTGLYRLPIRQPAPMDRIKKQIGKDTELYQQFDIMHVKCKFPSVVDEVAVGLGKMITWRRQLLRYRNEHDHKLRSVATATREGTIAQDEAVQVEPSLRNVQHRQGGIETQSQHTAAPSHRDSNMLTVNTNATTLRRDLHALKLDSGSYAPSTASLARSVTTEQMEVNVPPRPKDETGREKEEFKCDYCALLVHSIVSKEVWEKHVLMDLRPYVCTFPGCELAAHSFESRKEWYQHEVQYHRLEFFCNTLGHERYAEQEAFFHHMRKEHSDISKQTWSSPHILKSFRQPWGLRGGTCNLCLESAESLQTHVGRHLEQLALFSIPVTDYMPNEEAKELQSNARHRVSGLSDLGILDVQESEKMWSSTEDELSAIPVKSDGGSDSKGQEFYHVPESDDNLSAVHGPSDEPHGHLAMSYDRNDLFANSQSPLCSREYVIAVDFGTTFSGLAWASTSGRPTIRVITQWPSGRTDEKTPTTIRYEENGDMLWGSEIPHHLPKHEWFKLGLEPSTYNESRLARKYPSFITAQNDVPHSERMVLDYLSALRKHAETELDAALVRAKIIDKPRKSIHYIITVPAIWTDKTKDVLRTLACRAGMGEYPESVQVVTAPEAAAMHELQERTKPGETPDLKANDTFIICDAGGGTVEVISYTIMQLYPHPVVKENTTGSGGKCGSTFLNRIFAEWLERHLGNEPGLDEDVLSRVVDDFDRVKTTFQQTTGRSQHYFIQIPRFWDFPEKNITRGRLRLTQQDMEGIFRPVVKEIIALVEDQIARTGNTAKTVILVGGFGQSVYLRDALQNAVGEGVRVTKSMDPLCAVVKGAALYGLEYSSQRTHFRIESRKARKHYGTEALDSYDPAKHDRRRQVIDGFTGDTKAWVMRWFVHKEEPIVSSKPKLIPFYYEQKVSDGHPQKVSVKIFCSQSEKAPLHKDDQVSELVEVTADLTRIPDHDFNREIGSNNEEYYKLDFDIEMKCESATTEYRLVYNGKKYDVVRAEYA